jgi:hypothetical protein
MATATGAPEVRGSVTASVLYLSGAPRFSSNPGFSDDHDNVGLRRRPERRIKMANDPVIGVVRDVLKGGSLEIPDELRTAEGRGAVSGLGEVSIKDPDPLVEFTASLDRIEGYMYRPDPSIVMLKNQLGYELECLRQLVYKMSIA